MPSTVPLETTAPLRSGSFCPALSRLALRAALSAADARASGLPGLANRRVRSIPAGTAFSEVDGDRVSPPPEPLFCGAGVLTWSVTGACAPALAGCVGAGSWVLAVLTTLEVDFVRFGLAIV